LLSTEYTHKSAQIDTNGVRAPHPPTHPEIGRPAQAQPTSLTTTNKQAREREGGKQNDSNNKSRARVVPDFRSSSDVCSSPLKKMLGFGKVEFVYEGNKSFMFFSKKACVISSPTQWSQ
jgi:hypothetical protein